MSTATELAQQMRAIVERDNLPADHELRVLADGFDKATEGYMAKQQTVQVKEFMRAWARARRAYCHYTGEPLVG